MSEEIIDEKTTEVEDRTMWRVSVDLRESPNGVVAVYPKAGADPKADAMERSIAANAGEKYALYSVESIDDLVALLENTVGPADAYHVFEGGKFTHFLAYDDLLRHLRPEAPEAEPPAESHFDNVNHPKRYTRGKVECIDAQESAMCGKPADEAHCVAEVIGYLWRYDLKEPLRSIESAEWYLRRLKEKVAARCGVPEERR